jgi:acyl-coenzyme A thioesterase PaaI-like protein
MADDDPRPFQPPPGGGIWIGTDFQIAPDEHGIALCGACRRLGSCRLGITSKDVLDDGTVRAQLRCPASEEGGPGFAHGGWTAGVLNEIFAHLPLWRDIVAVTASLNVEYVKPVPIERPLIGLAEVVEHVGEKIRIKGELLLASTSVTLARAEGLWIEREAVQHLDDTRAWLMEQDALETLRRLPGAEPD